MNITNQTKSIFVCLISAISVPLALGKEEFPLEAWVKQCTITTADLNQRDASAVAGGITLEKHGKWGWSPKVEAAEGVLVLHPLAEDKPGVVKFKISPLEDKKKKVVIMARASNEKPGVSLKITAKQKSIKDVTLGPEWQKIEIPVADLPESTQEIVIEVHPILWFFEYCYIDYIGVK